MNQLVNQEVIAQIQPNYERIPLSVFLLGPNGSGKSSLRNYLNLSDIQTNIDPDVLNRIYRARFPKTYQIEAGKQALKMYANALELDLNLCLESTLAGRGTIQRIMEAKERGYYTLAYYVGLNSIELNLARVALRVARGGHDIPKETVARRYQESALNLPLVKDYLDMIYIVDNSEDFFRLQYSYTQHELVQNSQIPEEWAEQLAQKL